MKDPRVVRNGGYFTTKQSSTASLVFFLKGFFFFFHFNNHLCLENKFLFKWILKLKVDRNIILFFKKSLGAESEARVGPLQVVTGCRA